MTTAPPALEPPQLAVRRLVEADAAAARALGQEAFGVPTEPPSEPATVDRPGQVWFGAFDGETLAARMVDRSYDSYYGGAVVPTSGIAGVTVAAEYRGRGALGPLFAETLAAARARGAVVSTLFPTAPRIYRRFGYEVVADFFTAQVPTAALASVNRPDHVRARRAGPADYPAIQAVYDAWAGQQNGPLTRRGVSFPATAEEYLEEFTGVTVAVDAGDSVLGYVSWSRGQGYGEKAVLEITDLLATGPGAYQALLLAMGSFSSVTPQTRIDTSGEDVLRTFLPTLDWQVVDSSPYMLRILDVAAALSLRRYPAGLTARLEFGLTGDFLADLDGGYLLDVDSGSARCRRAESADRLLTPRGLALTYAGAQSAANLRMAGQLTGGDPAEDAVWDGLFGGRQAHIRDYF
jgi:predicted acetyltransferase